MGRSAKVLALFILLVAGNTSVFSAKPRDDGWREEINCYVPNPKREIVLVHEKVYIFSSERNSTDFAGALTETFLSSTETKLSSFISPELDAKKKTLSFSGEEGNRELTLTIDLSKAEAEGLLAKKKEKGVWVFSPLAKDGANKARLTGHFEVPNLLCDLK